MIQGKSMSERRRISSNRTPGPEGRQSRDDHTYWGRQRETSEMEWPAARSRMMRPRFASPAAMDVDLAKPRVHRAPLPSA